MDSGVSKESRAKAESKLSGGIGLGAARTGAVIGGGGWSGGSTVAPAFRSPSVVAKRAAIGSRKTAAGSGRGGGMGGSSGCKFDLERFPSLKMRDLALPLLKVGAEDV